MSYRITDTCNGCGACLRLCPVNAIQGEKKQRHVINRAICIECGACGRICPQMSVRDAFGIVCDRIKRSEWLKPAIDKMLCMSCTICLEACPVHCLGQEAAQDHGDPHAHPFLKEPKACIGCGFCALDCPVEAIKMAVPLRAASQPDSP